VLEHVEPQRLILRAQHAELGEYRSREVDGGETARRDDVAIADGGRVDIMCMT